MTEILDTDHSDWEGDHIPRKEPSDSCYLG